MPNTLKTVENPPDQLPQPLLRESWPVVGAHPPAEAKKTRTGESALLIYVETALCTAQLY